MAKFGDAGRKIAHLLSTDNTFYMNGVSYTIVNSGKPTCYKGEPKTDIYVFATSNTGSGIEIKISFKKENTDFIENKTNSERAEALFGDEWKEIIKEATRSISAYFKNKKVNL